MTSTGEERRLRRKIQPVYDDNQRWIGTRVSHRDETIQLQLQREIQAHRALYHAMFEQNVAIKLLIDPQDGAIVDANGAACRFYGYTHEELCTKRINDINMLPPEQVQEEMQRAKNTDRLFFLFPHRLASGEVRNVEVYSGPIEKNGQSLLFSIIHDVTDRVEHERTLTESEALFRALVEETDNIVTQIDQYAQILYLNRPSERFFGLSVEECIGKQFFDFTHPDDRDRTALAFEGWIRNNATHVTFENRMVSAVANRHFYILWTINLLYDKHGSISCINAIGRDISEYKRIEQALRESEARYRLISELISDFAYALRIHQDGTIELEWATDAFARTTGFSPEELRGKGGWDALIHPDDMSMVKNRQRWILAGQSSDVSEFRIITKDGNTCWLRNHWRPVWNTNLSRMAHIYGAARDITYRRTTEQALKESRELLQSFLDNSPTIIFAKDIRGRYILTNRQFEQFFKECTNAPGLCEFIGKSDYDLFPKEVAEVIQANDEYVVTNNLHLQTENVIPHPEGQRIYSTVKFPIYKSNGEIYAIGGVAVDSTDRKQTEEALRESEERFRFIAEFTHDWEYWLAPDGTYLYVSPSCQRVTGYRPEDFIEDPELFERIIHPNDYERVIEHLHDDFASKGTGELEFRIVTKSGRIVWIGHVCQPVYNEDGTWLGRRGSNREIMEQKIVESELKEVNAALQEQTGRLQEHQIELERQNEQLQAAQRELEHSRNSYADLYHSAPVGYFTIQEEGYIVEVNQTGIDLILATRESLIGTPFDALVFAEDMEVYQTHRTALINYAHPQTCSVRLKKRDGSHFYARLESIVVDRNENQLQYRTVVIDVTNQRYIHQSLQESETRYRTIVEDQLEFICRFRPDGTITFVNEVYAHYFGTSSTEMIGDNFFNQIAQEDRTNVMLHLASLGTEQTLVTHDHRVVMADGSLRWQRWSDRAIFDEQGNLIEFQLVGRDTSRKRWTKLAFQMQHDLAIVLSSISSRIEVCDTVLSTLLRLEAIDCGAIYVVEQQNATLRLVSSAGISPSMAMRMVEADESTISTISQPSYYNLTKEKNGFASLRKQGIRSVAFIPVSYEGRIIAMLSLASHTHSTLCSGTQTVIESLTSQIGEAFARTEAYERLIRNYEMLEWFMQKIDDFLFFLDDEMRVIQWNPAGEYELGYSPDALTLTPFHDLCTLEDSTTEEDILLAIGRGCAFEGKGTFLPYRTTTDDDQHPAPIRTKIRITRGRDEQQMTLIVIACRLPAKNHIKSEE
jgi:PAS domain S-box-containing protein